MVDKNLVTAILLFFIIAGCASTTTSSKKELPNVIDPVCAYLADMGCVNIAVDENTPRSTYEGITYYFCSKECKVDFDKNPSKYLKTSHIPEGAADPVCHAKIEERGKFVVCIYRNNTYYFCSDHCRTKFMAYPDYYGRKE